MNKQKMEILESLLAKKRLRGLEDLFFFNKYVMFGDDDEEKKKLLVPHVHGEWANWFNSTNSRVKMILVPRNCFKSTFFTVGYILQQIAKNRDSRILIANATLGNSQKFLGEIKDHIRRNEEYKLLYGEMFDKSLKWNEDEIEISGRGMNIREATVTAVGVGGNLVSQHYSTIICDDLMNVDNSANRFQTSKVIDWWRMSLSLLDPNGFMLIIGTRWSYYDLYSYLKDSGMVPPEAIYIRGAYNQDGSPYFPERFDANKLIEMKRYHGSYRFSAFYLNDPVDEDTALIKRSQILYWGDDEDRKLPQNLNIFITCDPAISQETYSDYTTILIVGVSAENDWYVLEVRREKMTVGAMVEQLFAANNEWKPQGMSIEVIGQAQGLMTPIHDEENRRKSYLPIIEIKARPPVSKEMRIRAILQSRFERGKVFIKRDMFDLEEELLKFPKAQHDDIIDSLTDVEEVSFTPDEVKETKEESGSYLESRLFTKKEEVDETMGEDW